MIHLHNAGSQIRYNELQNFSKKMKIVVNGMFEKRLA